ncbi:MAG: hypothetical protein Q7L55_01975 [Actinomycetota bacterium]|nr:hypothetical protein [Actinomycetota bacterium]
MTEVEPGHRGLQAVAVVDPVRVARPQPEVAQGEASQLAARVAPAPRAAASKMAHQIVLARVRLAVGPPTGVMSVGMIGPGVQLRVQVIVVTTEVEMIVLARVRLDPRVVVIDAAWIPAPAQISQAVIVRAVPRLVRDPRIVGMIGPEVQLRVQVIVVTTAVEMIAPDPQRHVRTIPIVAKAVVAMIVRARAIRIDPTRVAVMIDPEPRLRVPMIAMTVVSSLVPAVTVRVVQRLGEVLRIDVLTVQALQLRARAIRIVVRAVVATIVVAMTARGRVLRALADLARLVIEMSARARLLLGLDIPIAETNAVMNGHLAPRIGRQLAVRATLARSAMIAVRVRLCVVVMMAIRFVIRAFPMTSRQRILIAGC